MDAGLQRLSSTDPGEQLSLRNLYAAMRIPHHAPNAQVYAVGYPRFFPLNPPTRCGTGGVGHFSKADMYWVNNEISQLDGAIQDAAAATGVNYVSTYDAFAGHELCTASPDMNAAIPHDQQQSYHPNASGQAAIASIVSGVLSTGGPRGTTEYCGPGLSCTYRVRAYTDAGYGAYSNVATA